MIARDKIIAAVRKTYELFGFAPLDTPCMERWDVITGGDPSPNKSIFRAEIVRGAEDKGSNEDYSGEDFTMRFDLTVSLARVIAAYPDLPKPFKRYQIGKVWRGERPQNGRFREFMQFDADIIGSRSMLADTEIIQIMYAAMRRIGIHDDFIIRINNRKILDAIAEVVGCKAKSKEFYRTIDKIEKIGIDEVIKELGRRPDNDLDDSALSFSEEQCSLVNKFLHIRGLEPRDTLDKVEQLIGDKSQNGVDGIKELREIVSYLEQWHISSSNWTIDLSVARGLDYYTGPIFETYLTKLPEIGSVFSGGRFDGLSGRFIEGSNIPGVGASVGIDRLVAALQTLGKLDGGNTVTQVLVTVFSKEMQFKSFETAQILRDMGIKTEVYIKNGPLKEQISYGVAQQIPFILIIGPDELASDSVMLRNVRIKRQDLLTFPAFYMMMREISRSSLGT
jgi:histidyl-tRNA synthetase